MKCLVCGCENEGSVCQICGFHAPVVLGTSQEDPLIAEAVKAYRANILSKIVMELETYEYKIHNGVPTLENIERIQISSDIKNLEKGNILWFDEEFARVDAGEDLKIILYIIYNGVSQKKEIKIKAPDIKTLWKVGFKADEGLDYTVILGNSNDYIETERFCLIA